MPMDFKTATRESEKTGNAKQARAAVSVYWDLLPDLLRIRSKGATLRDMTGKPPVHYRGGLLRAKPTDLVQ